MTKQMLLLVGLAIPVLIISAVVQSRFWLRRASGDIRPKKLLTAHEQPLFSRLQQAFPDDFVFTQVASPAALTAQDLPPHQRFNRKVADFVLTTKAFEVLAVIELDYASHGGREVHDSKHDSMLDHAGYRFLRSKHVPNVVDVQQVVRPVVQAPASGEGSQHAGG